MRAPEETVLLLVYHNFREVGEQSPKPGEAF